MFAWSANGTVIRGPGSERTMNSTNSSAKKLRSPWSADLPSAIYFSVSNISSFQFSVFQVLLPAPSSPKDEVAVATGLARPRSSALKQQYDQRNEHERDEQDYQPPLSRREQIGAGLILGGNDPAGVVCQLHRIFVELTLGGRHLLRRRVLPPVEHDLGASDCAFCGDRFLVSGTRFRRQLLYAGVLLPVVLDLCFKVDLHLSDQSDRVRSWTSVARRARNFGRYFPFR